jgi:UDP-N-acetylmuramoyl-tripeptide--D-alanyl-D-alanine ligase
MKPIWSPRALEEALNQKIPSGLDCGVVHFNSRSINKNDIFIALNEGRGDGHNYVEDALKQGAGCVIVSKNLDIQSDKIILVEDCMEALHKMASYKREKSKAKFIGVTGSSGKTSTKEILKTVLENFGITFASRGNFNNHIGVPLNIASLNDDAEYVICEMGMNHIGEISYLSKIVKPDIAIITSIGPAHYEFFNSVQDIALAKSEIFDGFAKNGYGIINFDGEFAEIAIHKLNQSNGKLAKICKLTKYNIIPNQNLVALEYLIDGKIFSITSSVMSKHQANNFGIALSLADCLGLDMQKVLNTIHKITQNEGRGKIVDTIYKGKNYKILCDYYNANPQSMIASLEYFSMIPHNKKVVIVGDMLELGESSIQFHLDLISHILSISPNKVICIGEITKIIHQNIENSYHFSNVADFIDEFEKIFEGDEFIFIKGSNSIKLSKIADLLCR